LLIEPWRGAGQPYRGSVEMRADVLLRRHLWVFAGGNDHPLRTPQEVFRGRAVHDIYGHALTGAGFGMSGELIAFREHARLFSPEALPALACDNLGQAAYYFHHPVNVGKPHTERVWAEQKVDFLPAHLWRHLLETP
jgi:hypothetical protein